MKFSKFRTGLILLLIGGLFVVPLTAQSSSGADLKPFLRSAVFDGVELMFVHLNNVTTDALFEAPMKYSVRAQASQSAMFYVRCEPHKAWSLNTEFVLIQGGDQHPARIHNIQNFEGGVLDPGTEVDGILQFATSLDLSESFVIRNEQSQVEFMLAPRALEQLESGGSAPTGR